MKEKNLLMISLNNSAYKNKKYNKFLWKGVNKDTINSRLFKNKNKTRNFNKGNKKSKKIKTKMLTICKKNNKSINKATEMLSKDRYRPKSQ